jgi:hypothetical protein
MMEWKWAKQTNFKEYNFMSDVTVLIAKHANI